MTMFKVELRLKARRDLAEIEEYLSQFFKSTPIKFLKEFDATLDRLSFSPWNIKWKWNRSYRCVYVRKYAVIYRVDEEANTVYIHRVLHGSRNFRRGVDVELMEERAEYQTVN